MKRMWSVCETYVERMWSVCEKLLDMAGIREDGDCSTTKGNSLTKFGFWLKELPYSIWSIWGVILKSGWNIK
jgi:hypothetical protein